MDLLSSFSSVLFILVLVVVLIGLIKLISQEYLDYKAEIKIANAPYSPSKEFNEEELEFRVKKYAGTKTNRKYVIIGSGSVGLAILEFLQARGEKNIRTFDLKPLPSSFSGVEHILGNISNLEDVKKVCEGADVVFHTAALIHHHTNFEFDWPASYSVNVIGTQNIVEACKLGGVKYLIHTSTPLVTFKQKELGKTLKIDETREYTNDPISNYAKSKTMAEKIVLSSNNQNGLKTISLRPFILVFGSRDVHGIFSNSINDFVSKGSTIFLSCKPLNFVYVENVAYGHILAEKALDEGKGDGQVFNISNLETLKTTKFINLIKYYLEKLGYEVKIVISPKILLTILAYISYYVAYFSKGKISLGQLDKIKPIIVKEVNTEFILIEDKAKRILGYSPIFSVEEGIFKSTYQFLKARKKLN